MNGAWLRLWAPELAAGGIALVVAAGRLRPRPGVPWDSVAVADVWVDHLRWPGAASITANVLAAGLLMAAATAVDFTVGRGWRRARLLRWRWTTATDAATLRRIRAADGVATATCSIRTGDWAALEQALDPDKGKTLRQLSLDYKAGRPLRRSWRWWRQRAWGSPIRAQLSTAGHANPARDRTIRLYYRHLGDPWKLPAYDQPADGSKVMIGRTYGGPVMLDLDNAPHTQVIGGTGSGKGYVIRLLECQALRAGWLLILLDGGASPEHAPLDGAPNALRPMREEDDTARRLRSAIAALGVVAAIGQRRALLAKLFHVDRWVDLPAEVRRWQPRIAIVVDELTALLADEKDRDVDRLRAELRRALDVDVLRNGRKFGIHILPMSDQFAYSAVFSKGAQRQAADVIVLGNLAGEHVRQATGLSSLPTIPEEVTSLAGHYVRFGNPNYRELRIPPNGREALERAAAYTRGEAA